MRLKNFIVDTNQGKRQEEKNPDQAPGPKIHHPVKAAHQGKALIFPILHEIFFQIPYLWNMRKNIIDVFGIWEKGLHKASLHRPESIAFLQKNS